MSRTCFVAVALAVALPWSGGARADEAVPGGAPPPPEAAKGCAARLDAEIVVRCALAASPEVARSRHRLAEIAGRRITAGLWLPTNPIVAASVSRRRRPDPEVTVLNWTVALSQEIEIAGQRGARLEVADTEAAAQVRRVAVAEQEAAAGALAAFFEAAAAAEQLALADAMAETGKALAALAEGRAREALMAGVEADVARAEAARLGLLRFDARHRSAVSTAALALLVGAAPRAVVVPALSEVRIPALVVGEETSWEAQALRLRGEIGAAEMERRILEGRLSVLKRERVPNLTISGFAEKGEIDDQILGVGLSLPIPIPAPVGRTRAGEIAEVVASIRAAESSIETVRRRVRLEVARATSSYRTRDEAAALLAADLLARARADLTALREALSARQLTVREVVVWQRSLLELLQADIEIRLARALARVELRRVTGLPMVISQGAQQGSGR